MLKLFFSMLIYLVTFGCTNISTNQQEASPTHVIKASKILVVSSISNISGFPRSISDKLASAGRDINQFNIALDSTFGSAIISNLKSSGIEGQLTHITSGGLTSESQTWVKRVISELISTIYSSTGPEIAIAIEPTEIKTNIPGSFSGVFLLGIFDVKSGELVWKSTLYESQFASSQAHQEVATKLASDIVDKLKHLGFI